MLGQEGRHSSTAELSPPNFIQLLSMENHSVRNLATRNKDSLIRKVLGKDPPRGGEKTNLRHQKVGDLLAEVQAFDDLD